MAEGPEMRRWGGNGEGREWLDASVSDDARAGLTGTAPANVYKPVADGETITQPPDGRPAEEQPAWRKDFPIDWPQDHYVARRDFAKFLVLTSLAFAVGQLWIGVQNVVRRRRGAPPVARVAALAEVPVGKVITFNYPAAHDSCVLIRTSETTLLAYSQKCTHLSCAVIPRPEKGDIFCPCHEGRFDLGTGRPIAGPPRRPLARITLEVRQGIIYATGVEERTV